VVGQQVVCGGPNRLMWWAKTLVIYIDTIIYTVESPYYPVS